MQFAQCLGLILTLLGLRTALAREKPQNLVDFSLPYTVNMPLAVDVRQSAQAVFDAQSSNAAGIQPITGLNMSGGVIRDSMSGRTVTGRGGMASQDEGFVSPINNPYDLVQVVKDPRARSPSRLAPALGLA